MLLTYRKVCGYIQLQEELLLALPSLVKDGIPYFTLEGIEDTVMLDVPDDIDKTIIDRIVEAHIIKEEKPAEDWAQLEQDIRATPLFYRLYATSKDHPELGTIYTLIQDTVTSTHNANDLAFALADLQRTIVPALSVYELTNFNEMLGRNNIPLQIPIPNEAPLAFTPPPDWRGLELALRNTTLFYRVYMTAKQVLPLNTIFTLLQDTITSTHIVNDLQFVLNDLQATIQPPLSEEEIRQTNEILKTYNFPIVIS